MPFLSRAYLPHTAQAPLLFSMVENLLVLLFFVHASILLSVTLAVWHLLLLRHALGLALIEHEFIGIDDET